ncbi:MAG: hypothetical protein DRI95_06780 [Bacteroidetes bacterium]|nr:MAG: hypothetical protein DRI95_06780 [Bacteroidota bacterium]RLD75622.1 MAG: hypothetical protein DRJ07_17760 [Bacteroidota bacterium]
MIIVKFDSKKGTLHSKFEGKVTLKEIVDYIVATKENKSYPRVLKILTNATHADMVFSPEDLAIIVEENYKSLEKYEYIIDAIVISSPKETAFSVLYQELAKTKKYLFQVFSTDKAAIEWLDQT